jgi:hypothetical protein
MTGAIQVVYEDDDSVADSEERAGGVVAALTALVAATAAPPEGEPDGLLAAFDAMVASRAEILARLQVVALAGVPPGGQALLDELARRDQAWISALVRAQDVVGDRLRAVRRAQRGDR